jgi:hypothetical protein
MKIERIVLRTLFAVFALTICSSLSLADDGENLSLLNREEVDFLLKHAPETNKVVPSGAAIVYGRIIEPPILITINEDRLYIGGVQVTPRQQRASNFRAKRKVDQIHEQYFLKQRHGGRAPAEAGARKQANDMMPESQSARFEFKTGKTGLQLKVTDGDSTWRYHLDASCPASLLDRYLFIIRSVMRAHALRRDADGEKPALEWLHSRFADLKGLGVLSSYEFSDSDEVVRVQLSCNTERTTIGFYRPQSPSDLAREKRWKAKQAETKQEMDQILHDLAIGQLLIYADSFVEKRALKSTSLTGAKGRDLEWAKSSLGLSPNQAQSVVEELH